MSAALDTIAVDAQGSAHAATILMDASWRVEAFSKADGQALGALSLSCAFPWGQDAIYLFSSLDRERAPVEASPSPVAELLLFPPVVPLRWQPRGFQAISAREWEALVITELADRPATCASAPLRLPGEAPTWDDDRASDDDELSMESSSDNEPPELLVEEEEDDDTASAASYGAVSAGSD